MRLLLLFISILISQVADSQIINASPPYRVRAAASSCDADAQTFIDSAGISDQTEIDAICELVKDLKDSSLWTSMYAIYPMAGGAASTHKWNLKDPQNTDAAFRVDFQGSWTHSSSGANPIDGYGNTFVNGSTTLGEYDRHWSLYFTESTTNTGWQGFFNGTRVFGLQVYDGTNLAHGLNTITASAYGTASNSGYFIGTVNSSSANDAFVYRAGVLVVTTTALSLAPNLNFYLGKLNSSGTPAFATDRNIAFATLGSKLTSTQARALNNIVEEFNDALGRGVQ